MSWVPSGTISTLSGSSANLNIDEIAGFEDEGRVIALEDMPKIKDILGMPVGAK